MNRITTDQLALELLLRGDEKGLKALAAKLSGKVECPACGNPGPHPDNGDTRDLTYCCEACGEHFDAPENYPGKP